MLFFLTGDIQTGKTRWLQALIDELGERGIESRGVLAPGRWVEHRAGGADGSVAYEKVGIDNLLLPEGRRIAFARRNDLAREAGALDAGSQSSRAGLSWVIDDDAIALVNAHLESVLRQTAGRGRHAPSLLAIDEIGQLELRFGGGLVAAMQLVDRGATDALPHAVVIVRRQLLEAAQERFAAAGWGGMSAIGPDDEGRRAVLCAFGAVRVP